MQVQWCCGEYDTAGLVVHRSQHEELDLVSVEEFYKQAPSHILKSVS